MQSAPDLQDEGGEFDPLPGLGADRPLSERELRAARDRLVAFAASRLGYRFDKRQRRELLGRLRGGETEDQVRAGYEATIRELEDADAGEDGRAPPDDPT